MMRKSLSTTFLSSFSGQSVLEYMFILVLVMAAIIIGGPYIIRSWNANIKGWDDSVHDSYMDPMLLADRSAVDLPDCNCNYISPCKNPPCCGFGKCTETQDSQIYSCVPLGCGLLDDELCTPDPGCCAEEEVGCGVSGCGIGEMAKRTRCGDDPSGTISCFADTRCGAECTGPIPQNAELCAGSDLGLDTAYPNILVSACDGGECQWTCIDGYRLRNGSCRKKAEIRIIDDRCIHDGGCSGGNDSLVIYNCNDVDRYCLTAEYCPWDPRNGGCPLPSEDDGRTCEGNLGCAAVHNRTYPDLMAMPTDEAGCPRRLAPPYRSVFCCGGEARFTNDENTNPCD